MLLKCALFRVAPTVISSVRALGVARHPLILREKYLSLSPHLSHSCISSRKNSKMASNDSVEGKMKELSVGGGKQKPPSRSLEVRKYTQVAGLSFVICTRQFLQIIL